MSQENLETPIVTWGEHTVTLQSLLSEMKYQTSWHLIHQALNRLVIRTLFEEHGVAATDDQIVEAMDNFREQNDLYTEEEITQWLTMRGLSDDEFYEYCTDLANRKLLREKLVSDEEIVKAFTFRKLDLDRVELYHLIAPTIDLAEEILEVAKEGSDFFGLAKKFSAEEETRKSCGYLGPVTRSDLRPEIAAAAFSAAPGTIIGPFKGTRGFHLYLVDQPIAAELDDATREEIADELLLQLLQKAVKKNTIEYQIPTSMSKEDDEEEGDDEAEEQQSDSSGEDVDVDETKQSVVTEQ